MRQGPTAPTCVLVALAGLVSTGLTAADRAQRPSFAPHAELTLAPGVRSTTGSEKPPLGTKIDHFLLDLHADFELHRAAGLDFYLMAATRGLVIHDGWVVIDAVADGEVSDLLIDLETIGLQKTATFGRLVSGRLPIASIPKLQQFPNLRFVRAATATTNSGLVTSQGDVAMHSDDARSLFGVDGTGIVVGSLSDSFDCNQTEEAVDVSNGDLPAGIIVLDDFPACGGGFVTDEGRAMMQIIHDVAPGADQAFHTAFNGIADFATGILELASDAGADVIVDDVTYHAAPMFQDGAIAQAADQVSAAGVSYFSSAGNFGRNSYEGPFNPSGQTVFGFGEAHDFDPSPVVDLYQNISLPYLTLVSISLQWDSPYFSVSGAPGSANDLDIFITDEPPTQILQSSTDINIGADPVEVVSFFSTDNSATYNIVIEGVSGPMPGTLKYVIVNGDSTIDEHATASSTIFGHPNAAGAVAVGAAAYFETPAFGTDPALLEHFSSAGSTPILFDLDGSPISEVRQKPEIVCPDGVNTTFFGFEDPEPDGFPNFFGTSAAAPHAAAVAALLLELEPGSTPAAIYSALESTAIEMGPPGFDNDTGYGLCQADLAAPAIGTIFTDGFESGDVSTWSSTSP